MNSIQNDGSKVNCPDSWQSEPESARVTCEACGAILLGEAEMCQRCGEL